jgi:hypothetical protein
MDVESTIQFLLDQQAQHEARQQQFEIDIAKVNEMLLQTNANLVHITAAQERASEILATLAERQVKTEDALSALMLVVEAHIANHSRH